MARIRTIKPEFFRHEALFEAERDSQLPLRLAFAGLLTCCDREGRFRWRPRQLKLDILPYDDLDFSRVLDALATRGFIVQYEVDGTIYGHVPSWHKHQQINNKELSSSLPAPPNNTSPSINENNSLSTREARVSHASVTEIHSALTALENSQGEKEGERNMEGNRETEYETKTSSAQKPVPLPTSQIQVSRVFEHWKQCMEQPKAVLDTSRRQVILSALKTGYSVEQLCEAITGCSLTPHNCGNNERQQRFDGLNIILRDADQIDRFIRNCHNPPTTNKSQSGTNKNLINTRPDHEQKQFAQTPVADITWLNGKS